MGRARYPGLWRVLDREANRLDHVVWCDVTNRGYTVVEVTPSAVSSQWWFVHPYDDDPAGAADLAASFTVEHSAWPPDLRPSIPAPRDPPRPGLPAGLPPRPGDLARIRRRRRVRIGAKALGTAAAVVATVGAIIGAAARGFGWRRRPW